MNLTRYDAAKYALQQAVEIDEVKDIRDKAQAMAAYAKQAKDTNLVEWATEIKVRAERRAGQMLAEMPKNEGKLNNSSRSYDTTTTKLSDIGISKDQSSRWQKLAAVPEDQFEQAVSAAKEVAGEVTTAAMLRIERANRPAPEKVEKPALVVSDETQELRARIEELTATAKELLEENASMGAVMDADDKLAALTAENKKLRELNRALNERIHGMQNECNEAKKSAKYWKAKFDKQGKMAA